jgi:hypothetical protein
MSLTTFFEIFGGVGAVLIGISGCLWKLCRSYDFKCNYNQEDKKTPIEVFPNSWEHQGNGFPKEPVFGKNYNRFGFAQKNEGNWKINIEKDHGSVYLYIDVDQCPHWEYNKGSHYLRINIQNINENINVKFQHKFWGQEYGDSGHDVITKSIKYNGVNIFTPKCLINTDQDVEREQIGIYISGNHQAIKDIIIDEAYYGEKWNFCKCCCKYILYRKKQEKS